MTDDVFEDLFPNELEPVADGEEEAGYDPDKLDLTPMDLADKLIALNEGVNRDIRYIADRDEWLQWDGVGWIDFTLEIDPVVSAFLKAQSEDLTRWAATKVAEAKLTEDADLVKKAEKRAAGVVAEAKRLKHPQMVANVKRSIETTGRVRIVAKDLDAHRDLLGTPGGVYDLRSGQLWQPIAGEGPQEPKDLLITKITAVTPAPIEDCPRWHRFMDEITCGNVDHRGFLGRALGYGVTGHVREQKFLILFGSNGRNGKGVMQNVVRAVIGRSLVTKLNRSVVVSERGAKNEDHVNHINALEGSRLAFVSEVPQNAIWQEARIKELTGGDPIASRRLYANGALEIDPSWFLIIALNRLPQMRVDRSMRERVILFELKGDFSEGSGRQDQQLETKLLNEGPGILRWLINRASEWHRAGLAIPEDVRQATKAHLDDEDIYRRFLDDNLVTCPGYRLSAADLYKEFRRWAVEAEGIKEHSLISAHGFYACSS